MAKKKSRSRIVTFRTAEETYNILERVARLRGIDVSALLNTLISEAMPELLAWLSARFQVHLVGMSDRHRVLLLTPKEMALFTEMMDVAERIEDREARKAAAEAVLARWDNPVGSLRDLLLEYVVDGLAEMDKLKEELRAQQEGKDDDTETREG